MKFFFHPLALSNIDDRHPEALADTVPNSPGLNQHPEVNFSLLSEAIQL
jgi:hypothetical protein